MKAAFLAFCGGLWASAAFAESDCADVALVLALDGSSSIKQAEFNLQTMGYYRALTGEGVQDAIKTAGVVEIAAVFWADSGYRPQVISWHRVEGPDDAARFAETLISTERLVAGGTDIGTGIAASLALFNQPGFCADRMVIDISGDGKSDLEGRHWKGSRLSGVRQQAEDMGVTINALAITSSYRRLADYYRTQVTTGPNSFVMEVGGFETFHLAIVQKLMRELLSGIVEPERRHSPT